MSLNYELPNDLTNGDLEEMGYDSDAMLGLLLTMMACGVGDLSDKGEADFYERVPRWLAVTEGHTNAAINKLSFYFQMVEDLRHLKTNVARKTESEFKSVLNGVITDRGVRLRSAATEMAEIEKAEAERTQA